jgi:hypothetical protein
MFLALRLKHESLRNFQQVEKRDRFSLLKKAKPKKRSHHRTSDGSL